MESMQHTSTLMDQTWISSPWIAWIHTLNHPVPLFLVGLMGALGWAPYHQPILFLISLNLLLLRLWSCSSAQKALKYGWFWGCGLWFGHLFWVGNSLLVDAHRFGWLWPISMLGIPAIIALYPACLAWIVYKMRPLYVLSPLRYIGIFSMGWSSMEMIQGHLFTGLPWNLTAYIWQHCPAMMQGAAWVGSYGLGLLTMVLFSLPALFFLESKKKLWSLYGFGMGLVLLYGLGMWRLQTPVDMHPNLYLRLVQPSIPQTEKIDPTRALQHFETLIHLSQQPSHRPLTHLIWPESALPWTLTPAVLSEFPDPLPDSPCVLFTGTGYRDAQIWNSILVKAPGIPARILYHKQHLVPFGEYMPGRDLLERILPKNWIHKITPGKQDFSGGTGSRVILAPNTPPCRPLICYEAIFPGVGAGSSPPPQWILNLSNDGWFGYSPGPYQHFASACFRAVEEGLPMVRVANTGISAMVDPYGRILQKLDLNIQGWIDSPLPKALPFTLYRRLGEVLWGILFILGSALVGWTGGYKARKRDKAQKPY